MMEVIMIIFLTGSGVGFAHVYYGDMNACEDAKAKNLEESINNKSLRINQMVCVEVKEQKR